MTIELTPKQERILHDALQQGRFHSVNEALDEALRSLSSPASHWRRRAPDPCRSRRAHPGASQRQHPTCGHEHPGDG